ncbi:sulfurtransferase [Frigoribacterium sp. 2-23]|uniref:sulfurtransferase n=1 Tax=Frigoribacterium sp. 2-23 TaxID=3415006 RepID=UPI003C6FF548
MPPVLTAPIVSTQWLADHIGADDLVIVDATVLVDSLGDGAAEPTPRGYASGRAVYAEAGHVPDAVFADLIDDFSDTDADLPFTRPDTERFENAASALGISNDTTVVVYDSAGGHWASRLWWLFRSFGYDDVAVLDGGFATWVAEDRPIRRGHRAPKPSVFLAEERSDAWVDKRFVERVVAGDEDATLVCALPAREFAGAPGRRSRRGHIPGSFSVPASELLSADAHTYRPVRELRSAFPSVSTDSLVVVYCGAGVSAASDALALTLAGHERVALYDGSLNEWAADPDSPLVTLDGAA